MEENHALDPVQSLNLVQMVNVLLMGIGASGHLGHLVDLLVQNQDQEVAVILPQQMEEDLVRVQVKSLNPALEINVLLMVFGESGHPGHLVRVTARSQEPESVTDLLHKMEEKFVLVRA